MDLYLGSKMKCNLCKQEKVLIKKSHIIPDFMYKGLFDNQHFINKIRTSPINKIGKIPTGEYDSDILCKQCDNNIIGRYETYSSKALYGGMLPVSECPNFSNGTINGIDFIGCSNIEYHKFKLFLLSILWRASISSRPFFKYISLGVNEENIRKMILKGEGGDDRIYQIYIVSLIQNKTIPHELICQPHKFARNGNEGFTFFINGLFYIFLIHANSSILSGLNPSINRRNKMKIICPNDNISEKLLFMLLGIKKD